MHRRGPPIVRGRRTLPARAVRFETTCILPPYRLVTEAAEPSTPHVSSVSVVLSGAGLNDADVSQKLIPFLNLHLRSSACPIHNNKLELCNRYLWVSLDLSDNSLSAEGVATLLRWWREDPRLLIRSLRLYKNLITEVDSIAALIENQPWPLEEIHLSHNLISQSGAAALFRALANARSTPDFPAPPNARAPPGNGPYYLYPRLDPARPTRLPVWIRMEYNRVKCPHQLLQEASIATRNNSFISQRTPFCFAEKACSPSGKDPACTPKKCSHASAASAPLSHLFSFLHQLPAPPQDDSQLRSTGSKGRAGLKQATVRKREGPPRQTPVQIPPPVVREPSPVSADEGDSCPLLIVLDGSGLLALCQESELQSTLKKGRLILTDSVLAEVSRKVPPESLRPVEKMRRIEGNRPPDWLDAEERSFAESRHNLSSSSLDALNAAMQQSCCHRDGSSDSGPGCQTSGPRARESRQCRDAPKVVCVTEDAELVRFSQWLRVRRANRETELSNSLRFVFFSALSWFIKSTAVNRSSQQIVQSMPVIEAHTALSLEMSDLRKHKMLDPWKPADWKSDYPCHASSASDEATDEIKLLVDKLKSLKVSYSADVVDACLTLVSKLSLSKKPAPQPGGGSDPGLPGSPTVGIAQSRQTYNMRPRSDLARSELRSADVNQQASQPEEPGDDIGWRSFPTKGNRYGKSSQGLLLSSAELFHQFDSNEALEEENHSRSQEDSSDGRNFDFFLDKQSTLWTSGGSPLPSPPYFTQLVSRLNSMIQGNGNFPANQTAETDAFQANASAFPPNQFAPNNFPPANGFVTNRSPFPSNGSTFPSNGSNFPSNAPPFPSNASTFPANFPSERAPYSAEGQFDDGTAFVRGDGTFVPRDGDGTLMRGDGALMRGDGSLMHGDGALMRGDGGFEARGEGFAHEEAGFGQGDRGFGQGEFAEGFADGQPLSETTTPIFFT